MNLNLNILLWGACLFLAVSTEVRAADADPDFLATAQPWFDQRVDECRAYSGTTVVIVDQHRSSAPVETIDSLDVIYRSQLGGGLVVLGVPPAESLDYSVRPKSVAAYCRLAFEMRSPIFNAASNQADILPGGAASSASSTPLTNKFYIYYPLDDDGNLLTAFSGGSQLRNAGLIDSIASVLDGT